MEDTSVNIKKFNKTMLMVKWKTHQRCAQTAHERFNEVEEDLNTITLFVSIVG